MLWNLQEMKPSDRTTRNMFTERHRMTESSRSWSPVPWESSEQRDISSDSFGIHLQPTTDQMRRIDHVEGHGVDSNMVGDQYRLGWHKAPQFSVPGERINDRQTDFHDQEAVIGRDRQRSGPLVRRFEPLGRLQYISPKRPTSPRDTWAVRKSITIHRLRVSARSSRQAFQNQTAEIN